MLRSDSCVTLRTRLNRGTLDSHMCDKPLRKRNTQMLISHNTCITVCKWARPSSTPRLLSVILTFRQKAIFVPSGHLSEFPRSSPISILLGCDTGPDVAAPLTSRLGPLTGHLGCSSQGQGVTRVHSWCALHLPLCSSANHCHIPLISLPALPVTEGIIRDLYWDFSLLL